MKKILLFAVTLIVFTAIGVPVYAAADADEIYSEQLEASGADRLNDALPDGTVEILDKFDITYDTTDSGLDTDGIFSALINALTERINAPLAAAASMLAVIAISAAVSAAEFQHGRTAAPINFVTAICLCMICTVPLCKTVEASAEAVKSCGVFMLAFVPVYAAVIAASGYTAAAGGFSSLTFGAAEMTVQLADRLLIPLCKVLLCCSSVGGVGEVNLNGFVSAAKRTLNWLLGAVMTVFIGVLGLQTSISGASDSVGLRTAKFVAGSFVPVIGSAVSESLATVQGCLSLLKTGIGTYAVAALAVIVLPPLIELILWRIALELTAGCCDVFDLGREAGMMRSVSAALAIVTAVLLCCAIMFIVSVAIVSQSARFVS